MQAFSLNFSVKRMFYTVNKYIGRQIMCHHRDSIVLHCQYISDKYTNPNQYIMWSTLKYAYIDC